MQVGWILLTNLLNKWPDPSDKIILITNGSHPGNKTLEVNIKRNITFYKHNILISWNFTQKYLFFPRIIEKFSSIY